MIANILPTDTPLQVGWGVKWSNHFFLEVVMLHVKFKGIGTEQYESINAVITYTLDPGVGSKGHIFFSESSYVAYQIKVENLWV